MSPLIQGELAANHGLITRRRALELGLSAREVDGLVITGTLTRVRRGVYALSTAAAAATTLSEKQRLTDRAACLRVEGEFVRSHTTAALELGIGLLLPTTVKTHVTGPWVGVASTYGVKHHVAPYDPAEVVVAHGHRVLPPVRTALDIAREYGHPYGVVAIDRVRWLGHPLSEFEQMLETLMKFWPDRRRAVRELELSDPGAESVLETLGRMFLVEAGLGPIETQFGLTGGGRTAFADMRVGRQLFECDGEIKYLPEQAGGIALRPVTEIVLEEKDREDWFRGFHLGISRLGWRDVWGPGRQAAMARVRREAAATERLWGSSIDDLERFRVRRRRPAA